jgi:hypothetical protein
MRVDRSFRAGSSTLSTGDTHLWIIDFKTSEQGSRTDDDFAAQEKAKYSSQLEAYARAQLGLPGAPASIILGLYYPLGQRLISWETTAGAAV